MRATSERAIFIGDTPVSDVRIDVNVATIRKSLKLSKVIVFLF